MKDFILDLLVISHPLSLPLTIRDSFKFCQLLGKGGQLGLVQEDLFHQGVEEGEGPVPAPQQGQLQQSRAVTELSSLKKQIKHERGTAEELRDPRYIWIEIDQRAGMENKGIKRLILLSHTHSWFIAGSDHSSCRGALISAF